MAHFQSRCLRHSQGVKCCRRPLHHAVNTERRHAVPGYGRLQQSGSFSALVQQAVSSPATYPDLSDYDLVFFGDSVMGNYKDFASIPGVIGALTGAKVHNLAVGGSSATRSNGENASFNEVVENLLSTSSLSLPDDDKLCFVINYGLNDYFEGYPLENIVTGSKTASAPCGMPTRMPIFS